MPRPRTLGPREVAALMRDYRKGVPIAELCDRYGISRELIRRIRIEYGVPARPVGAPPTVSKATIAKAKARA